MLHASTCLGKPTVHARLQLLPRHEETRESFEDCCPSARVAVVPQESPGLPPGDRSELCAAGGAARRGQEEGGHVAYGLAEPSQDGWLAFSRGDGR